MVQRFEELEVWKESRHLAKGIYVLTNKAAFRQDWDLSRQIRRAAVSVMSNIAEGFERETNKEFARYLYIAKGSVGEVLAQLYLASDLHYAEEGASSPLIDSYMALSRQLASFIAYLHHCVEQGRVLREISVPYELTPSEVPSDGGTNSSQQPATDNQ